MDLHPRLAKVLRSDGCKLSCMQTGFPNCIVFLVGKSHILCAKTIVFGRFFRVDCPKHLLQVCHFRKGKSGAPPEMIDPCVPGNSVQPSVLFVIPTVRAENVAKSVESPQEPRK